MPRKPKRPCRYPCCPNLTDGIYCEEHAGVMERHYEKFQRGYSTGKRYGRAWTRIRHRYANKHPLCEMCMKEGRYVAVEEVHHIVPLSEGGTHDESNLMSLCRSCHEKIHKQRGDRGRDPGGVEIPTARFCGKRPGVTCAKKAKSKG